MNVFAAILWKDLLIEWRSRERVVAMLMFSLLMVIAFHFSLRGGATAQTRHNAPGLLWVYENGRSEATVMKSRSSSFIA